MGRSPMDAEVIAEVEKVCAASAAAGTAIGMFTPDPKEIPRWRELGASLFLLDSDQGFILAGAAALAQSIRSNARAVSPNSSAWSSSGSASVICSNAPQTVE